MKLTKTLLMTGVIGLGLLAGRTLMAQDAGGTPPVVVPPQDRVDRDLLRDLRGAPPEVQKLILSFDQTRDKYLAEQRALLAKLRGATADERAKIRQELQANRQAFLAELQTFREDLRKDLKDLTGKISNQEVRRILDAARVAARDRAHHRGSN
jgi:hypothetical protein